MLDACQFTDLSRVQELHAGIFEEIQDIGDDKVFNNQGNRPASFKASRLDWLDVWVRLFKWDSAFVPSKPLVKGLQCWVEGSGNFEISGTAKNLFEIALELEHIAEILSAWEAETSIHLGRYFFISHFLSQCCSERGSHPGTG